MNKSNSKDKDVTLLLGKKLLLGWTMLNEVCKECVIVPLVEDKKNNLVLCVSCERVLKRDEKGDIIEDKSNSSNSAHKDSNKIINIVSSLPSDQVEQLQQQQQQQQQNISSTSSTPLPSPPSTSNNNNNNSSSKKDIEMKDSIATKKYYDDYDYDQYDYDDDDEEPLTEEEKILIEKRLKKSDEFSSKMGEYLLKGWTLLSDICPNYDCFGVPLLKDREKRFYCVSCEKFGLDINDLLIKKEESTQPQPQQATLQPIQSIQQVPQIQEKQLSKSESINDRVNITPIKSASSVSTNYSNISPPYPEPDQKKQKMIITPTPTTSSTISPTNINSNTNNSSFLSQSFLSTTSSIINQEIEELPDFTDNTLKILFDKLKEAQSQFVQTNNIAYCSLIREYSQTISSLLEMKKNWL